MGITSTLKSGEGIARVATGTYITDTTAAAHDVNCGFTPKYVRIMNETGDAFMEWNDTMADAEAMVLVGDTDPVTWQLVTSNGVTPLDDGTTHGFRIGLNTDVNVTNQQVSWLAIG